RHAAHPEPYSDRTARRASRRHPAPLQALRFDQRSRLSGHPGVDHGGERAMTGPPLLLSTLLALAPPASAPEPDEAVDSLAMDDAVSGTEPVDAEAIHPSARGLEALVPEVAQHPYHVDAGERVFLHRFAFSPAYGSLGTQRLFTFRLPYNPKRSR